jgi:hypothetical protein
MRLASCAVGVLVARSQRRETEKLVISAAQRPDALEARSLPDQTQQVGDAALLLFRESQPVASACG